MKNAAFDYLIAVDNKANEYGDDSSGELTLEMPHAHARAIAMRKVELHR